MLTQEQMAWGAANDIGWHYIRLLERLQAGEITDHKFWEQKVALVEIIRKNFGITAPAVDHGTLVVKIGE